MRKASWHGEVDWELQDVAIARQFGLSRERVRQVRKQLGKPQSKNFKAHLDTFSKRLAALEGKSSMTAEEIAKAIGASVAHTRNLIKATKTECRRVDRRTWPRRGLWSCNWDEVDFTMSPQEISKATGVLAITIYKQRLARVKALGLPRLPRSPEARKQALEAISGPMGDKRLVYGVLPSR